MTKSRPKTTWGGRREGSGRPRKKTARCACGAMTLARALTRCPRRHNAARCAS